MINLGENCEKFIDIFKRLGKDLVLIVKSTSYSSITGNVVKKGAKGEIVEEINIKLAGFGGGVPKDEFDDETEAKVKNFEKAYMKKEKPTGIVDFEVAKAIDEFGEKYTFKFDELKCNCKKQCGGFGKERHKNEYSSSTLKIEAFNKYEYPGMHRLLLWALKGLIFHLESENPEKYRVKKIYSGYQCHDDNNEHIGKNGKPRTSTNHMGKALDIHIDTKKESQKWSRPTDDEENLKICNEIRKKCTNYFNAQIRWDMPNKIALEPSEKRKENEPIATVGYILMSDLLIVFIYCTLAHFR